jgi:hypothetical protein
MDAVSRIKELYQNYCSALNQDIHRLNKKMNQSFDASIQHFNPQDYPTCPHLLTYYQTKEKLESKKTLFRKECSFYKN